MAQKVDYTALKKGGYMRQKQKGYGSLRLAVVGGNLTAENIKTVAEVAEKYGRGYVHMTSRQGIEIPFIKVEELAEVKEALSKGGVGTGVCGPRVRTVTACQGSEVCPSGCIDTYTLAKELDERYFGRELPHKFKFGVTGCQNNCLKAEENDVGIKGGMNIEYKEDDCISCGVCVKACRQDALKMVDGKIELDEKMQREEAQRLLYQRKSVGLRERRFWEWKFENDNGSNQKILIARQYVENWTDMKRKNVGLLLMGPVGTGKSFFAGCIANALLEQGERVMMTNFSRILNEMTSYQADKNQIIQNLVDYPLLIIDDLGIERNSEFALEQVYNVIDSRYCKMLPLIVTTNLGLNEMKSTDLDTAHQRIYSRILEMCVPIYCGGEDKRKEEGTEKLVQVQSLITG